MDILYKMEQIVIYFSGGKSCKITVSAIVMVAGTGTASKEPDAWTDLGRITFPLSLRHFQDHFCSDTKYLWTICLQASLKLFILTPLVHSH